MSIKEMRDLPRKLHGLFDPVADSLAFVTAEGFELDSLKQL